MVVLSGTFPKSRISASDIISPLFFSFLDGFAQEIPVQSPISITKFQKSARMSCEIKSYGSDFDTAVIHWYQQKQGKAPQRVLYFSSGKASVESGFQSNKYLVEKVSAQKRCVLTIKDIEPDDAGTYYCAYWDPHRGRNSKIIKAKNLPQRLNHNTEL